MKRTLGNVLNIREYGNSGMLYVFVCVPISFQGAWRIDFTVIKESLECGGCLV